MACAAQVWKLPAFTAAASVIPTTCVGASESDLAPLPSWPSPLRPQQEIVPPVCRAHVWVELVVMAVAPLTSLTSTGVVEPLLSPLPI